MRKPKLIKIIVLSLHFQTESYRLPQNHSKMFNGINNNVMSLVNSMTNWPLKSRRLLWKPSSHWKKEYRNWTNSWHGHKVFILLSFRNVKDQQKDRLKTWIISTWQSKAIVPNFYTNLIKLYKVVYDLTGKKFSKLIKKLQEIEINPFIHLGPLLINRLEIGNKYLTRVDFV